MEETLSDISTYAGDLLKIGNAPPPAPRWNQSWFPRLDAAAAYTIVRQKAPILIVEIGSGHSTRFMAQAIQDSALSTKIYAIDPAPRAAIAGLPCVDASGKSLQETNPSIFSKLRAGDILFIDSSHILMPGTDVDYLLSAVLPALPAGTIIHIHDIFLPSDYPADWAWRGYNEQSAIATLLLHDRYEILFSSQHVVTNLKSFLSTDVLAALPPSDGAPETSLWLRKKGD